MAEKICGNCKFYADVANLVGLCFFNPPVYSEKKVPNGVNSVHPDTYQNSFCGRWYKRKEQVTDALGCVNTECGCHSWYWKDNCVMLNHGLGSIASCDKHKLNA